VLPGFSGAYHSRRRGAIAQLEERRLCKPEGAGSIPAGSTSVATWDDVRRIALALPETSERESGGNRQLRVKNKLFVWERPLRRADLKALGDKTPSGPILGARVEHLVAKEALLANDEGVFFTTPHFDGYPIVLLRLDQISAEDLDEVVVEAWLARAPTGLAEAYLEKHPDIDCA
jgi:hypothetical protein